jgi:hypothetical protein
MTAPSNGNYSRTLFIPCFIVLFFFLSATCAQAAGKDKKGRLNEHFRSIQEKMKGLYDSGKLEQLIEFYKTQCLKEGGESEKKEFKAVNKETRAEIYRLVYLAYTALDMLDAADFALRKYLVIRHREGVKKTDWVFIQEAAREKYYVAPRLLLGLLIGMNFTMMDPGARYMVLEPVEADKMDSYRKDYDFHLSHSRGQHIGMALEYALTKHLSLTVQPSLTTVKFKYKNTFEREREDQETVTLNYDHRHKLSYIEVPVLLTYRWLKGKLRPYVQAGFYYSLLQGGEKSLRAFSLPDRNEYEEEAIIPVKDQLTASNFGLWLGAGFGYELKSIGARVQMGLNYRHGLNNVVDSGQRYENKELMFAYYDVFDDMKLRNWDITVSVMLPLSYKAFRR